MCKPHALHRTTPFTYAVASWCMYVHAVPSPMSRLFIALPTHLINNNAFAWDALLPQHLQQSPTLIHTCMHDKECNHVLL